MKLVEGQIVYVRLNERHNAGRTVLVTKVGRKWVTLDNGRWRVEVGGRFLDGERYGSPGEVFLSEDEYKAIAARDCAWSKLARAIERTRRPTDSVSLESIEQVMKLLGIEP
jgi:hypothetical protein